jgi:hypothetical protein
LEEVRNTTLELVKMIPQSSGIKISSSGMGVFTSCKLEYKVSVNNFLEFRD